MTIHVVEGLDGLRRHAFSAEDVRRMVEAGILTEDDRVELIEGVLVRMASKGFAHERAKNALISQLHRALDPKSFYIAVESTLRLDRRVLVEPDILICPQASVRKSAEGFVEVIGPEILLLIEVADSSLRYDKLDKAPLYAAFGVPEYWIIDVNAQEILVHRERDRRCYLDVQPVSANEAARPLAPELSSVSIRLADLA